SLSGRPEEACRTRKMSVLFLCAGPRSHSRASVAFISCSLDSDSLDLAQRTLRQILHGHTGPGWFGGEMLGIHLVKGSKISDIRQEAGRLNHLVKAGAGGLQNRAHISATPFSLGRNALRHLSCL